MSEPRNRYSAVSLTFHWGIAALLAVQIGLYFAGEAAEGSGGRDLIAMHKALGITILVLTLARLGWRFANPPIPLPAGMPGWQKAMARVTQGGFYLLLIGMPLGGWAASSAAGRDISWFGLFNVPLLPLPADRELAGRFMDMHELGALALYLLLFLHIAGALKHHFIDHDNVLHRMIPGIPRRP